MTRRQYHVALAVLVLSGLLGGMLGSWMTRSRLTEEVIAESFVVVDESGATRAQLSLVDGEALLGLWDEAGNTGVVLGIVYGEPRLTLGQSGTNRVVLGSVETTDQETGIKSDYPISTITLFGEDNRVQWQAP